MTGIPMPMKRLELYLSPLGSKPSAVTKRQQKAITIRRPFRKGRHLKDKISLSKPGDN
ncbi:predicted protein [Botrytis cinerea T4]|uniref:Uncharacterized protein n=1 Tax=Botryotinia fuckeliana (strain T4) TaxID=999810 RepID=G2YZL0_BOTF4|nr:predicted protein [Botrytis cinerea T4]